MPKFTYPWEQGKTPYVWYRRVHSASLQYHLPHTGNIIIAAQITNNFYDKTEWTVHVSSNGRSNNYGDLEWRGQHSGLEKAKLAADARLIQLGWVFITDKQMVMI